MDKTPRPPVTLAALGLIIAVIIAVAGIAWDAVVNRAPGATTALSTIASLGVGSLATLLGVRHGEQGSDTPER